MGRIPRGLKSFFVLACLLSVAAWVVVAQNAKVVDDNALRNAAKNKEEWISYNRDWAETRYSPLDQVNATNVKTLGLAWSYDIPSVGDGTRQEGTPLISNGVMYSITPWSVVYALDARTGKEKWKVDPEVNKATIRSRICCGVVNRGVALYKNKLIVPVVDGRMRALDIETGKVIWETQMTPQDQSYSLTMAPRVIKGGKVIMGAAGGEYAVRGFFSAFDAETGKELWKFYTVPGNPSKPQEQPIYTEWAKTWDPKFWATGLGGGGPVWGSIAYDAENDLVYVGTGQPGPWTSYHRGPGDNLCTNCIIAVKGETGKYAWHYQTTPGDDWDYDSIADITLADLTINGRARKVLMHAPKNGFVFVLDRVNGDFISATPWVQVSWATGVDAKGKIQVNPAAQYGTTGVNVIPGPGGGHVWPPQSFNPTTGLLYIPSTAGGGYNYQADPGFVATGRGMQMGTGGGRGGGGGGGGARGGAGGGAGGGAPGRGAPGGAPAGPGANLFETPQFGLPTAAVMKAAVTQGPGGAAGGRGGAPAGGAPAGGAPRGGGGGLASIGPTGRGSILVAWNPATAKEAWRGPSGTSAGFNAGGTLTTAGNLVFTHVSNTLFAFNAATGEQVLNLATGLSGSPGPPMTFMLDGVQYIAIAGVPGGGGGGDGRGGGPAGAAGPGGAPGGPGAGGRGGAGGGRGGPGGAPAGPGARLENTTGNVVNAAFVQGPPVGGAGGQGRGAGGAGFAGGRGGAPGGGAAAVGFQASQARMLVLKLNGTPLAAGAAPAAPGGN